MTTAALLESAKYKLREVLTKLDEESDRNIAEDIGTIFLANCADKEYNVEGVLAPQEDSIPGFQLRTGDVNIYTLLIMNLKALSMRTLIKHLVKHTSVFDVTIDNDIRPEMNGRKGMTVLIQIWKSRVETKNAKKHEASKDLQVNMNMNGLIINKASKQDARDIIEEVVNMEKVDMWEPKWENIPGADGQSYLLVASPVRRMTLSFYRYLCSHYTTVKNVRLVPNVVDGNLTCLNMAIHCTLHPDSDNGEDDDEDEDEEEGVEANGHLAVSTTSKKKDTKKPKLAKLPIEKKKNLKRMGFMHKLYKGLLG